MVDCLNSCVEFFEQELTNEGNHSMGFNELVFFEIRKFHKSLIEIFDSDGIDCDLLEEKETVKQR